MATIEVSAVIDATVDATWAVLGDFGSMPLLSSRVVGCQLENGHDGRASVGAVRTVEVQGGAVIKERLLAHDEVVRRVTYDIVGPSRYPVRTYQAVIQVRPVTTTDQSFVRWVVDFDSEEENEAVAREMISATYSSILADLARRFVTPHQA